MQCKWNLPLIIVAILDKWEGSLTGTLQCLQYFLCCPHSGYATVSGERLML